MELKDTVKLMLSDDWRERLLGEYYQAAIRCHKLATFIRKVTHGEKKPKSDRELSHLKKQQVAMYNYIIALEHRMKDAGIEFIPFEVE